MGAPGPQHNTTCSDWLSIIYAHARAHAQMALKEPRSTYIISILNTKEAIPLSMHSDWLGIICAHAKAPMQVALEEARSISNFLILDTEEATSLHAF